MCLKIDMVFDKFECSFSIFFGNYWVCNFVNKVLENKDCGYIFVMLGFFVFVNIILNVKNDRCIF